MNISPPPPEEQISQDQAYDPNQIIELLPDGMELPPAPPAPTMASSLPVEETNIAEHLDEKELKGIAEKVIKCYEDDLDSRAEWEEQKARYLKLYYQSDTAENPPWEGASDESIPVLTEAVNQFESRSYKAFFPTRFFLDAIPAGKSNTAARERGERVAAHMNFQLGVLDRTYKRNKRQMFQATALHGSDFTKVYYDHLKRRVVIKRVRAQDLVVPYHVGPVAIEDLERKTEICWTSVNNTKILQKMGFYINAAEPYTGDDDGGEVQDTVDDEQGIEALDQYENAEKTALVLEQHCILDLDEDGIAEPYIVWVCKQSRKILRIQIRYEVDQTGAPVKEKEPIELYTHYQFLQNPDGFYGFGLGFLLGKINFALNKLIRMFIDAGELSTVGNLTYLISESLGIPGDDFDLVMGKGIKIPRSVEDIQKHFMKLEFQGPQPSIKEAIAYLQETAQRIGSSSDILAGQPDKVYQPTALLSMLEQGLQLYSTIQESLGASMEDELQKVYRLNSKYLKDEEYVYNGDQQIAVTGEDYKDDFRIVPIFDPKYSTQSQKMARAQAELAFVQAHPLTAQNPVSLYLAGKKYLEAIDAEDIDEILPPPQPPPQPVRLDDQNLENAYFIMPPDKRPMFDVFPDQEHLRHIQSIDKFIDSFLGQGQAMEIPTSGEDVTTPNPVQGTENVNLIGDPGVKKLVMQMSAEQKQELLANLLRHRAMHLAFFYGQMNGAMDEQGQPTQQPQNPNGTASPGMAGQGLAGPMAQAPDDSPDMEAIINALQASPGTQVM